MYSYQLSRGWKLSIEGNNITREPEDRTFVVNRKWPEIYNLDGTSWTFGLRASF